MDMDIDKIFNIVLLAYYAVLAIVVGISTIISQAKKRKKENKDITLSYIYDTAMNLIEEAEKFKNYSGEEKKNYVMTRMKQFFGDAMTDSDFSVIIEDLIQLSKRVNINKPISSAVDSEQEQQG